MNRGIHIVAVGARTPLGLDSESSMAAVRAGITQITDHPFMIDRVAEPVRMAQDSHLDPRLMGPERMLELVSSALEETCAQSEFLLSRSRDISILLGLPEERPGWSSADVQVLRDALSQKMMPYQLKSVEAFCYGHAAGSMALITACSRIQAGEAEVCIVAGVDSYFHHETLQWLDQTKQLATSYHRGAFFPGEGAGAFIIASDPVVKRFNLDSLALVCGGGTATETHLIKTEALCLGEGLTLCIRKATASLELPHDAIEGIICDINGERYRSEEWGFALLRIPEVFDDPTDYEAPASSWGDVGAASGTLFIALAVTASRKGWAKGSRYLIWNSSEAGHRAAVVLELNLHVQGE